MALQKFYWFLADPEDGSKMPVTLTPGYDLYTGTDEEEQHGTVEQAADQATDNWGSDYDGENYIIVRGGDWNGYQPTYIMSEDQVSDATVESIAEHCLTGMSGFNRWRPWLAAVFQEIKNRGYNVKYVFMDVEAPKCSFNMNYAPVSGNDVHMHEVIRYMQNHKESRFEAAGMPEMDLTILDQPSSYYYNLSRFHEYQQMRNWTEWAWRTMGTALDTAVGVVARAVWPGCVITNYQQCTYSRHKIIINRNPWPTVNTGTFEGYSSPPLYLHNDYFLSNLHCLGACEAIGGDKSKIIPWVLSPRHEGTPDYNINQTIHDSLNEDLENWGIEKVIIW